MGMYLDNMNVSHWVNNRLVLVAILKVVLCTKLLTQLVRVYRIFTALTNGRISEN